MRLPAGVGYREFEGVERLATRGEAVGTEATSGEWRVWDPGRSKLAAMLELGMEIEFSDEASVLYLGAGAGTTVSHLADVTRPVYAVEFAPRPARELIPVAESRPAVIPLLKDAREPERYAHVVEADLDLLVQDVATRGQAAVANANRVFLADAGQLLLAIKARSEDVTASPASVFEDVLDELAAEYVVEETARLDRYHGDHLGVVARPR